MRLYLVSLKLIIKSASVKGNNQITRIKLVGIVLMFLLLSLNSNYIYDCEIFFTNKFVV